MHDGRISVEPRNYIFRSFDFAPDKVHNSDHGNNRSLPQVQSAPALKTPMIQDTALAVSVLSVNPLAVPDSQSPFPAVAQQKCSTPEHFQGRHIRVIPA